MVDVRVENAPERPGHARIIVRGVAAPATPPAFLIRREGYQEPNLGPRGWQVREEELQPVEMGGGGDSMALLVGPHTTRHLEPMPYVFEIPSMAISTAIFWPDGIDYYDGILPPDPPKPGPGQTPANRNETVVVTRPGGTRTSGTQTGDGGSGGGKPAPPPPPPPPPPPVKPHRRWPYVVAALLLLLVGAGAGAWYAFPEYRPGSVQAAEAPPPPPPVPAPAATDPTPAPPPAPPGWPDAADGLSPVEVVQRAPNDGAILAVARQRLQAGRYEDALQLFEELAERGDGPAATALARMYDPNGFEPGKPFRNPDGRTAARYYKDAVARGDSSAAAPREALRQRLEKEAGEGNGSAATALKDFWP